ncbi:AAA family ATPase [Vibrio barjaei]|uniref:AAA family ATPase n=1 Tax=Vibrio barjaei TaxID=1676683 RepID=A0ABW7IPX6_9VIBR|nr:MoxR family ATPase [Vibrio barjaei]MCY9873391.1 MoxR family ATPase [Vibrio barjaei]OIN24168.1 AAA family ATPase [Vibrio barjaei]
MNQAQTELNRLISEVGESVIGQQHVVTALVVGLITNGHILLEGLPGTAKTRSIKALADRLHTSFGRIQFTPDLLPSDVTGTEIYQDVDGKPQLHFQSGPIFNSIVLADEINRAPAKVQAALLEAMAEGTVTVGGESHSLPELFMVLATQNPIEQEGTYPLPEAQMDRFIMKVTVDYPEDEAEKDIIRLVRDEELGARSNTTKNNDSESSISPESVFLAREEMAKIEVSDIVENYIVGLVMATRQPQRYPDSSLQDWILVGASPRASIALDKCSRAYAWLQGRSHVEPDDVRAVAHMVLSHRVALSYNALAEQITQREVVDRLLDVVAIG